MRFGTKNQRDVEQSLDATKGQNYIHRLGEWSSSRRKIFINA